MTTEVSICNLAVAHLGQQPKITSISPPDGYAHSAKCAVFYPMARDTALQRRVWSWAVRRAVLTGTTVEVVSSQYPYAFLLPADFLDVVTLLPEGAIDEDAENLPFLIEGDVLLTIIDAPIFRYTRRITDTTKFSPMFVSCVAWLLASYLAGSINEDLQIKDWALKMFEAELNAASSANSRSNQRKQDHSAVWSTDR